MDNNPILRAIRGEEGALKEVISSFEGLVVNQARKYTQTYGEGVVDFEDVKQICYEAIIKCIPSISENRINTAPAFIINSIKNAITTLIKKRGASPYIESLYDEIDTGIFLLDVIESNSHVEEDAINNIMLGKLVKAIDLLEEDEKELVKLYLDEPYGGLKSYANKYKVNYRQVRYKKDILLNKLKRILV